MKEDRWTQLLKQMEQELLEEERRKLAYQDEVRKRLSFPDQYS